MPLTDIQRRVVRVLNEFRARHDYVGGGAALNQKWPRLSDDLDIFHDRRNALPQSARPELEALKATGFSIEIMVETDSTVEAIARLYGFETRIQWLDDEETSRRFFPAIADEELGFRLHQADLAVNKVLCASRRRTAARDAVDVAAIVERYAPLGPLVWAACAKEPNVNPSQMVTRIRDISFGYSEEEISTVRMEDGHPADRAAMRHTLDAALDQARTYCEETAPIDLAGHLFVDGADIPINANEQDIENGRARALEIRLFGPDLHLDRA
jgi:hypothetical protein